MEHSDLCKPIVDCIIRTRYDLMYECDLDTDRQRERTSRYYAELTEMFEADPRGFADAVEALWQGTSDYAAAEETVIRMECVGMYCDERLRVEALRMFFYFGIDPERSWSRFKERVAYICLNPSKNLPDRYEAERGYENLALSMFLPNGFLHGRMSSYADQWLTEEDCVTDVYSAVFYGDIMDALGKGKQLSSAVKTVTVAIRHVGVIEGDGLVSWAKSENQTALRNVAAALKRIGAVRSAAVMREFLTFIRACMDEKSCAYWKVWFTLTEDENKLLQEFETRLYQCLAEEDVEALSENYIRKSHPAKN